jgi:hypothetical protein
MPDGREKGLYSRYVSECNEAGDEEMVDVIHYVYGVGVAQPQSELHMRSRSCAATIGVAHVESELRSHDRNCMCGVGNGWSPYIQLQGETDYGEKYTWTDYQCKLPPCVNPYDSN